MPALPAPAVGPRPSSATSAQGDAPLQDPRQNQPPAGPPLTGSVVEAIVVA